MEILTNQRCFKFSNFSFLFVNFQTAIEQSNTRAVIAAVFESLQSFQNNGISFTRSDIGNNSTHNYILYLTNKFYADTKIQKIRQTTKSQVVGHFENSR